MPITLTAVSPVIIENIGLARTSSVDLVSFEKEDNMVVTLDETDLTLTYDTLDRNYKGTRGIYKYRTSGPSFTATNT
tara:strand:+ start:1608 stop:1838 length:231 start_codon:yes stop_codon:yes gene_type:complete